MLDFATGARWWLKFVLAPMIGGGGVVSIVFSATDHLADVGSHTAPAATLSAKPASQAQNTPQQPAKPIQTPQVPQAADAHPSNVSPATNPSPTNPAGTMASLRTVPLQPAQSVAAAKEASRQANFYATDRYNERFHGTLIRARRGARIGIHWVVDLASVTGSLHLKVESDGHTTMDREVDATGYHPIHVGSTMRVLLTEVFPGSERQLGELDVIPED